MIRGCAYCGVAILLAGQLLGAASAWAGIFGGEQDSRLVVGASERSWKLESDAGDVTISQTSFPIALIAPLPNEALSLTLSTMGALSSFSSAEDASLNGPTDTRLLMTYRLPNERLVLIGGVGLPTGVTDLTDQEVMVSRAVANQVLGFSTSSYGAGFDLIAHLIGAWPLDNQWSVGGGIGYTLTGEFDFATDAATGLAELNPGDELTFSAGASYHHESEELWSGKTFELAVDLDGTFRLLGADEVAGAEIFDEGNEFEFTGVGIMQSTRMRYDAFFRAVIKGDNALAGSAPDLEVESGLESLILANVTGNWVEVEGGASYRLTPVWDVGGRLNLKHFAAARTEGAGDENSLATRGEARVYEVGPVVVWRASERVSVSMRAMYLGGTAMDDEVTLSGFHMGASALVRF